MTTERWQRIEALYNQMLERPAAERASALAVACNGDTALQAEVQSLLDRASADGFLHAPALHVAARLITPARESLVGQRVGAFEVMALLGAGGMGEVYRARDTRLRRDVAIKILSSAFRDDPVRVARFEREARVLASLNHPHIGAVYGVEGAAGQPSLVMELVEGEDLAARLARGALPVREALEVASQICDALEAAHAQHIVHRDLKPANVRRRPDGTVKVIDFGLAKPVALDGSSSESAAARTMIGTIAGTPAYMSPEQARGEAAESQSDIWSFGGVLYEMLTGVPAFARETTADTLAKVLEAQPDYSRLPSAVPRSIRQLIRRCLEKDRRRRLRHIGDARVEIEDALAAMAGVSVEMHSEIVDVRPEIVESGFLGRRSAEREGGSRTAQGHETRHADRWRWPAVALGVIAAALLGLLVHERFRADPRGVTRFAVHPPPGGEFQTPVIAGAAASVGGTVSPDGRALAFTATDASGKIVLWLRPIDAIDARALPDTEGAALPFWSPDSRSLAFFGDGKLKRIDIADGTLQDLCNVGRGVGGTWNRDGVIVFAAGLGSGLSRVAASGGDPQAVTTLGVDERSHRFPSFLPDGRRFLFYIDARTPERAGVFVADLDGSNRRRIIAADSAALYGSGRLLFVRQRTLFAQAFDAESLRLSGDPTALAERVPSEGASVAFSVSEGDVLSYRVGGGVQDQQFAWFDRTGRLIETVGLPGAYRGMDLSPDGARIAVHRHEGAGGDIWVLEPGGATTRVTFDPAQDNSSPIWSPDGKRLAFASLRDGRWGIYHKPAAATDGETRLVESELAVSPADWTPDGSAIVYWLFRAGAPDQWLIPATRATAAGGRTQWSGPIPLMQSRFAETHSQISPDGRWVAYTASTTGRLQIYVRPFPSGDAVFPVSTAGGVTPRWRPDGKELFYMTSYDRGTLMAAAVRGEGSTFVSGTPKELFDTGIRTPPHSAIIPTYHTYAVSPDGNRFLIPRPSSSLGGTAADPPITVVLNWTAKAE
jgi:Tol biopolymer transport system component